MSNMGTGTVHRTDRSLSDGRAKACGACTETERAEAVQPELEPERATLAGHNEPQMAEVEDR